MNKKGLIKTIFVLVILIIIFIGISFYFINKEVEEVKETNSPIQNSEQSTNNPEIIEETEQVPIAQPQTLQDIPAETISSNSSSSGSGSEDGGSGGGNSDGGDEIIEELDNSTEDETEENETELPPECVYIRNAKLPQCVIE